jgi:hypothetical protein
MSLADAGLRLGFGQRRYAAVLDRFDRTACSQY